MVHAGLTIYRILQSDRGADWSYTTCAECAKRADGSAPHVFDVRRLPNPGRLDLENGDEASRASSICEILRRSTDVGAIAKSHCSRQTYALAFDVPFDTPGNYVRSLLAIHGMPSDVADAFFADVSFAIATGRHDLLMSEVRLVRSALQSAAAGLDVDEETLFLVESELVALLASERTAA
jgi:hypothetical protein